MNWKTGGLLLGFVFFLAVLLVKPIGVSTQFVILDGIIGDAVNSELVTKTEEGYTSTNAYLAKSNGKYAKSVMNPLNYSFVFVLAMAVGGFLSVMARGGLPERERSIPELWRANMGDGTALRYGATFVGGFIVLYGARLAGGCTSGHMMSGMMQTALSGYLFAAGAFAAAIPVSLILFKKEA
ncbi:YeeE/YedE thiosulfate transporter family protein [Pseudophaeobacter sp. A-200-2]|uniref:YeeE/YedE thiosulfate transporter family protein n=1 Tax=Pseudophaeobacter sp. A-200-2 TaxID=3098145 RepID=UPI0034D6FB19